MKVENGTIHFKTKAGYYACLVAQFVIVIAGLTIPAWVPPLAAWITK